MYVNAKIIPVETGEVVEGNSSMIHLIHCKNLCKCYNVPVSSIIKKIRKKNGTITIKITHTVQSVYANKNVKIVNFK
jgi:hypothetical protein